MGLEVKFVERAVGRVPVTQTTARTRAGESPRVIDVSPKGLKALFAAAPQTGHVVALAISHPKLAAPIEAEGEVRWSRPDPDGKGVLVGVAFRAIPPQARARLAELIAVELGRRVLIASSAVGYAASGGDVEGGLFLYDGALKPKALVRRDGSAFHVERLGETHEEERALGTVPSLDAAVRLAFDREGPVRFEPPLE